MAPPIGQWHETPLIGTLKELARWIGVKPETVRSKVARGILWIMKEPDGQWARYFHTNSQYATVNRARVVEADAKAAKSRNSRKT